MRILDEKTKEFSEIVDYLAHPEEKSIGLSKKTVSDIELNSKKQNIENIQVPTDLNFLSDKVESPVIEENQDTASQCITKKEEHNHPLIDATTTESGTIESVIEGVNKNEACAPEESASGATIYKKPDASPNPPAAERNTSTEFPQNKTCNAVEQNNISPGKINKDKAERITSSQKDRMRIDEMIFRKEARNLSKAFTINDRFRFQLHLFDGDKEAFNTTLDVISSLSDYDSALTYLSGIIDTGADDQDITDFLAIVQNHFGAI